MSNYFDHLVLLLRELKHGCQTENVLYLLKLEVCEVVDGVDKTEHEVRARQTHDEVVAGLSQLRVPHHRPAITSRQHTVQKATSQLVTRSCRHMVNSSPVNSSHTRLIAQSTRHKRAHNKARIIVTTVICGRGNLNETRRCTFVYNMASYCIVCNLEVTDDGKALECDEHEVKKYGQLVTTPSDTTVNSSHDFTV